MDFYVTFLFLQLKDDQIQCHLFQEILWLKLQFIYDSQTFFVCIIEIIFNIIMKLSIDIHDFRKIKLIFIHNLRLLKNYNRSKSLKKRNIYLNMNGLIIRSSMNKK
jgi:hypothetical protein